MSTTKIEKKQKKIQKKQEKAKQKEVRSLFWKFIFWLVIAVLSLGFGIAAIIAAVKQAMGVSELVTGWDKFGGAIVSILYFLEAILFIFFIWYSIQKSIVFFKKMSRLKNQTGYYEDKKQKKLEYNAKQAQKKAEKEQIKLEKSKQKSSANKSTSSFESTTTNKETNNLEDTGHEN